MAAPEVKAQEIVDQKNDQLYSGIKKEIGELNVDELKNNLTKNLSELEDKIKDPLKNACNKLLKTDPNNEALKKVLAALGGSVQISPSEKNTKEQIDPSKSPMVETRTKEQINTIKNKAPTDKFGIVEGGKPDRQYKKSVDGKTLYAKDNEGKNYQKYNEESHTRTFLADFKITEKGKTEKYNTNSQAIKDAIPLVTASNIPQESKDLIIKALNNPIKENIQALQTFLKENISDQNRVNTNQKALSDGFFGPTTKEALTQKYLTEQKGIIEATVNLNNTLDVSKIQEIPEIKANTELSDGLTTIKGNQDKIAKIEPLITKLTNANEELKKANSDNSLTTEAKQNEINKANQKIKDIKTELSGVDGTIDKENPSATVTVLKTEVNNLITKTKPILEKIVADYQPKINELQTQETQNNTTITKYKDSQDKNEVTIRENAKKALETITKNLTNITQNQLAINTLLGSPQFKIDTNVVAQQTEQINTINKTISQLNNTADWTKYGTDNPTLLTDTNYIKQGEIIKENEIKEIKKPIAENLRKELVKIPEFRKENGDLIGKIRRPLHDFATAEKDLIQSQTKYDVIDNNIKGKTTSIEKLKTEIEKDKAVLQQIGIEKGQDSIQYTDKQTAITNKEGKIKELEKSITDIRNGELNVAKDEVNVNLTKLNKIKSKLLSIIEPRQQSYKDQVTSGDEINKTKEISDALLANNTEKDLTKKLTDVEGLTKEKVRMEGNINGLTVLNNIVSTKFLGRYPENINTYFAMRDTKTKIDTNTQAGEGTTPENLA